MKTLRLAAVTAIIMIALGANTLSPSASSASIGDSGHLAQLSGSLTSDELRLCLERGSLFTLGRLAVDSSGPEGWTNAAFHDLAGFIVAEDPELVAAAYVEPSLDDDPAGVGKIRVTPAVNGVNINAIVARAISRLEPDFKSLVSVDDVYAAVPTGYGFDYLCTAYIQANSAGVSAASDGSGMPFSTLSLVTKDATVEIGVSGEPSILVTDMRKRFGDAVAIVEAGEMPTANATRSSDNNGFNAGDAISVGGNGCTSSFELVNGSSYYLLTAGHCNQSNGVGNNGATVRNNNLGAVVCPYSNSIIGTQSSNLLTSGGTDLAAIWPSSTITPRMWAGAACTGGGEAITSGLLAPSNGKTVGFSGFVSGQKDAVINTTVSLCQSFLAANPADNFYACNLWRTVSTAPPTVLGDSGGPVFGYNGANAVWALGVITGSGSAPYPSTATYTYFTPVNVAAYLYGSSLVTGY